MKLSEYKSYDDLPLFLNSETVAKVLGVSPSSGYELMHQPGFPVLRVGNRMVVPKEPVSYTHLDVYKRQYATTVQTPQVTNTRKRMIGSNCMEQSLAAP